MIDTNLTGVFLMSQAVGREMAKTGGGVILHTASIDASGGDGPYAAYNASKAGLLGLSRTMALELAAHGIRSNCVSPGFTHTVMTEKAVGPKLMDYLNGSFARVPMKRLVRRMRSPRRSCSSPPTRPRRSPASTCGWTGA